MPNNPMAAEPLREWTLMFYFASDNALAPSTVSQLKAIKDAGFHPEANVIARFDPHTENTPTHIFDVNRIAKLKYPNGSRVGFDTDPYVRNLVLDKLWGNEKQGDKEIREKIKEALEKEKGKKKSLGNGFEMQALPEELSGESTPRESLKAFLKFCREKYPAKRFVLFILGHGVVVGNDLFLFDEHTDGPRPTAGGTPPPEGGGNNRRAGSAPRSAEELEELSRSSLSLKGVGQVLRTFREDLRTDGVCKDSEFELIGFHSCSMSGLEVAYELRGTANYMLASQGPAYVGSWPYKQILMRIFNDLNSPLLSIGDLMNGGLVARLKDGEDEATAFLRSKLSNPTKKLLKDKVDPRRPGLKLVRSLKRDLNGMLRQGTFLKEGTPFMGEPGSAAASRNGHGGGQSESQMHQAGRKRLSARLSELKERRQIHPRDVKDMVTTLFYYILYNSYDFQLAGYSFDLCLCDLKQVGDVGDAVSSLSQALRAGLGEKPGLAGGGTTIARELILLSHWDAQSFWQESYTDLYDFCFRLKRRCLHVSPELEVLDKSPDEAGEPTGAPAEEPTGVLAEIVKACRRVMEKLERGTVGYDDGIIVGADFTGAEYQYSHGLSVFFPWSRPINGFFDKTYFDKERKTGYEFSNETGWGDFLDEYFKKTMRETSTEENIAVAKPSRDTRAAAEEDIDVEPEEGRNDKIEREVLEELLKRVGIRVFSEGQLAKGGSDDKTDTPGFNKGGSDDKTGSDFPLIKNYPPITGKSSEEKEREPGDGQWQSQSFGPTFAQGLRRSKR